MAKSMKSPAYYGGNSRKQQTRVKPKKHGGAGIKVLCILLAITTAVCAVGAGLGWHNYAESKTELDAIKNAPATPPDDVFSPVIVGQGEDNGIMLSVSHIPMSDYGMYEISDTVEAAYTLTATSPGHEFVPAVEWRLSYSDPNSPWAEEHDISVINDYVVIKPLDGGVHTVVIECREAFGEQILVFASFRDNPSIYSSVSVDYVERVESVTTVYNVNDFIEGGDSSLPLTVVYGVGTVRGKIKDERAYGEFSDEAYSRLVQSNLYKESGCTVNQTSEIFWEKDVESGDYFSLTYTSFCPNINSLCSQAIDSMLLSTNGHLRAVVEFDYYYGNLKVATYECKTMFGTIDKAALTSNYGLTIPFDGQEIVF